MIHSASTTARQVLILQSSDGRGRKDICEYSDHYLPCAGWPSGSIFSERPTIFCRSTLVVLHILTKALIKAGLYD